MPGRKINKLNEIEKIINNKQLMRLRKTLDITGEISDDPEKLLIKRNNINNFTYL